MYTSRVILSVLLFCTAAMAATDLIVFIAFDYSLSYQASVENPCREPGYSNETCAIINNSHQLVIEEIQVGAPASKRYAVKNEAAKREQVIYTESGFTGTYIYGPIETIVAMDAHPNGNIYELTSNSSIYDSASERLVKHLHGCAVDKHARFSATFDPVTGFFHIFNSKGKHYIVPDVTSGQCYPAGDIPEGIVGAAYAKNPSNGKVHLYAINNNTNSFGELNLCSSTFNEISVIQTPLGDGYQYNFDAAFDADGDLHVLLGQTDSFYKLHPQTGVVSSAYLVSLGRTIQSFTFPASGITTSA